jgi:hypothetical protein
MLSEMVEKMTGLSFYGYFAIHSSKPKTTPFGMYGE